MFRIELIFRKNTRWLCSPWCSN